MEKYIFICLLSIILGFIGVADSVLNKKQYKKSSNPITNIYNYTVPFWSVCLLLGGIIGLFYCL